MVGVVGLLEDVERRAELGFKKPGEFIVLIGEPRGELGASEYLWVTQGLEAGSPPRLDLGLEAKTQAAIRELIRLGLTRTAHDVAEGGLAVALAEMTFPYGVGATVEIREQDRPDALLFGEAPSRVLFTVGQTRLHEATRLLEKAGLPYRILGQTGGSKLTVLLPRAQLHWGVNALKSAWQAPLREVLP